MVVLRHLFVRGCLFHGHVFVDYRTLSRHIYKVIVVACHIDLRTWKLDARLQSCWFLFVFVLCGVVLCCVVSVSVRSVSVLVRCWFGFVSVSVWFR